MKQIVKTLAVSTALLAGSLSTVPLSLAADAPPAELARSQTNDPLEDVNRWFFAINEFVDGLIIKPIAQGYRFVVPEFGRNRVRDFMDNLNSPVVFANDLLQGEFERAGVTLTRFSINTTVGLAGLFDPAESWGLEQHSEDFGQTLGVYGVGEGPYLFLPLLGPNPPRDLVGRAVDTVTDPLFWIGGDTMDYIGYGTTALNLLDIRARNIETLEELERTSIDYYAAVRSLYRQSREGAIRNGEFDFDAYELPEEVDPADLQ